MPERQLIVPSLTREDLSNELCELLNLPRRGRQGKAHKVVSAILKIISDALFRGERVVIDGFGIFETQVRQPLRKKAYFYPSLKKGAVQIELITPPLPRIIFKPSRPLKRLINE